MEHSKTFIISLLLSCVALFSYSTVITPSDKAAQQEILSDMQRNVSHMRTKYDVLSEISRIRDQFDDIMLRDTALSVVDKSQTIVPMSLTDFAIIFNYMFNCKNEDGSESFSYLFWKKITEDNGFVKNLDEYTLILGDSIKKEFFYKIMLDALYIECEEYIRGLINKPNRRVQLAEAIELLKENTPKELFDIFTSPMLSDSLIYEVKSAAMGYGVSIVE